MILSSSVTLGAAEPQNDKLEAISAESLPAFKSNLLSATTRHLNLLIDADGSAKSLKGKTADGQMAFSFYLMFELTGDQRFRQAALGLADHVLKNMRETKFGVLPIKEKEKPDGEAIMGGGPPALGFYTSRIAYILHKEGGRNDDLKYIAAVLDQYPWNEAGWWAADIDIVTGESKQPLTKPSPINKTASIAMAAGVVSEYVRDIDPNLSMRLKQKTDKCIYSQIIPTQEADGFWHYNLNGNDPKDKDILGYCMLTTKVLMDLQQFNSAYRNEKLNAAIKNAQDFSLKCIAPMTDPNTGSACRKYTTRSTPAHYSLEKDPKRGFDLGLILIGGGNLAEGIKITDASIRYFPFGDAGQDGVHATEPSVLILRCLQ